jgi:hypothetical protein
MRLDHVREKYTLLQKTLRDKNLYKLAQARLAWQTKQKRRLFLE